MAPRIGTYTGNGHFKSRRWWEHMGCWCSHTIVPWPHDRHGDSCLIFTPGLGVIWGQKMPKVPDTPYDGWKKPSHWQIFWYSACKNRLCDWPKMVEHGGCVIFGHSGDQFPLFTSLEQDWLAKTAWLALKLTNVARHPCRRHSEVNFLARKMILFIPLANLISIKTLVHFPALQVLC